MDRNLKSQNVTTSLSSMQNFDSRNTVLSGLQYESNKETSANNIYFVSDCSTDTNLFNFETLNPNLSDVSVRNSEDNNLVQLDLFSQGYLLYSSNPIISNSTELIDEHKTFINGSCTTIEKTKLGANSNCISEISQICYTEDYKDSFADIFSLESSTPVPVVSNYADMGFMQIDHQQAIMCDYNKFDNLSYPSPQASPNYLSLAARSDLPSESLSLYNCSFQDFVSSDEIYQPFCNDQDILNEFFGRGNFTPDNDLTFSEDEFSAIHQDQKFSDYDPKIQNVFSMNNLDCVESLETPERARYPDSKSLNRLSIGNKYYENNKPVNCNFEIITYSNVAETSEEVTNNAHVTNVNEKANKNIARSREVGKFCDKQQSNRIAIMIIKPVKSSLPKAVNKHGIPEKISDFINFTSRTPKSAKVNLSNSYQILNPPKQNAIDRPISNVQSSKRKTKRASKTKPKLRERKFSYNSDENEEINTENALKQSKCRICKESFPVQRSAKKYLRVAVEKMVDVCNACNICFLHKSNLASIPRNIKQFQCSYCYKQFSRKYDYLLHIDDHTTEKPFKCEECDHGFSDEETFIFHAKIHKEVPHLVCRICDKKFVKKSHLNQHFRVHTGELPKISDKSHKNRSEMSDIDECNSDPFLNCLVCDKSFTEKSVLNQHLQEHANMILH